MKQTILQRFFQTLCLLMLFSLFGGGKLSAAEQTWTWSASSGALGTATSADVTLNEKAWTVTRSKVVHTGFNSGCIQLGSSSGAEEVTLSSDAFTGVITSVSVECSSYKGYHKCDITVGGVSVLSDQTTSSWNTVGTITKSDIAESGTIQIRFHSGTRALYIKSVTVKYDDSGASSEKAPTISVQPVSAIYEQNATAKALTITASGNPDPTYQWYSNTENSNKNGTELEGETGTSFTPATTEVGTMYYYCVATNSEGSATSDVAAVTVKGPFAGTIVTMSSANDADIKFAKGSNTAAGAVWANSTPLTAKGITLSGDKGSNTICSYYDGTVVRFYSGNNLIITPEDGITIEKIEIVRYSTEGDNNKGIINCTVLTASGNNTTTNTNVYTGSATSAVTFTATAQARFT